MDGTILQFLTQYGLVSIFILIMLEYACFPISSELVLPISGMLAAQLGYPITGVILLSVLAGILGSSGCYFLGRWGGERVMGKLLHKFPSMARKFAKTCEWQKQYGKWAVMLGRVVPIFRTYISFAAGITRQNYFKFAGFSAIGILSWNSLLLSCGFLLGENFDFILPYIQKYLLLAVAIVIAILVSFYLTKRHFKKRANKKALPSR